MSHGIDRAHQACRKKAVLQAMGDVVALAADLNSIEVKLGRSAGLAKIGRPQKAAKSAL